MKSWMEVLDKTEEEKEERRRTIAFARYVTGYQRALKDADLAMQEQFKAAMEDD